MERRIKLVMFTLLIVNSALWLNNISIYPSLCFPRFNPSINQTNSYISYPKFSFKNADNETLSEQDVLLKFKPYDKRFYMFSLKMIANEELEHSNIQEMPPFVKLYKDSIEF